MERYGMLTILERLPNKQQVGSSRSWTRWRTVCDCGQEKIINGDELGRTLSCGCARSFPYGFQTSHDVFLTYKYNAKTRGLVFGLSESRLRELIHADCHFCGFSLPIVRSDLQEFVCNGIDRLDNLQGYIEGNVVSCCKICNHAKFTMSELDFVAWILRAAQYQKQKATSTNSFSKGQAA